MQKIIIHIGTEKTATTSLQRHLTDNHDRLLKHNVIYPSGFGHINHWDLVVICQNFVLNDDGFRQRKIFSEDDFCAYKKQKQSALKAVFDDAKAHSRDIIISTEHAHSRLRTQAEIRRFVSNFREPGFDIKVIVSLRPQSSLALSNFSTLVRNGAPVTNTYLQSIKKNDHFYNYSSLLNKWADEIGLENISVIPFQERPDIRIDIEKILGRQIFESKQLPFLNESLSIDEHKFAIWSAKRGTFQLLKKQFNEFPRPTVKKSQRIGLTEEHTGDFRELFEVGNKEVCKKFQINCGSLDQIASEGVPIGALFEFTGREEGWFLAIERMLAYNFFERLKNARTILNNAEVSENILQYHLRIHETAKSNKSCFAKIFEEQDNIREYFEYLVSFDYHSA